MTNRTAALLVGAGGALGATCRWGIGDWLGPTAGFPWATFVVNVVGCALLGAVVDRRNASAELAVGTGFCGGLTTFSTFAVEIVVLSETGHSTTAALYLISSVTLGVLALSVVRRIVGHR